MKHVSAFHPLLAPAEPALRDPRPQPKRRPLGPRLAACCTRLGGLDAGAMAWALNDMIQDGGVDLAFSPLAETLALLAAAAPEDCEAAALVRLLNRVARGAEARVDAA